MDSNAAMATDLRQRNCPRLAHVAALSTGAISLDTGVRFTASHAVAFEISEVTGM